MGEQDLTLKLVVVGNGRSVHTLTRSAAIAACGVQVRLVTLGPALPEPGLEVCTRAIPENPLAAVLAGMSFLRDIRAFKPDLLHLHYAGGKLGSLATIADVHPFVVTVMGGDVLPEQHLGGLSALERRATRRVLAEADLILAKSDSLRPAIAAMGGGLARVETVRWGVDPTRFRRDPEAAQALRAQLGLAARARLILSPRTPHSLYNIHLIVQAMPAVLRQAPDAVLLITESGADTDYLVSLHELVRSLALEQQVRFVGRSEHGEMPALYSLAEAVVMVPLSDGLPQSLFEAMACETPVVLGRLPAYAEAVTDHESAWLVEADPASIAAGIARLLGDTDLRAALARRAHARLLQLASLPAEAQRVVAYYRELLAQPRRHPFRPAARGLDALSLFWR